MRQDPLSQKIDWLTILLFMILIFAGWLNIYAAEYDPDFNQNIFSLETSAGKQLVWIATSLVLGWGVFFIDYRMFESIGYIVFISIICLLIIVLFAGKEVAGSKSWFGFGGFGIQPSEFAKFATLLGLAKFLSHTTRKLSDIKTLMVSTVIILTPMILIVIQGDTGTALVFAALFIPIFREGVPTVFPIIAVISVILFLLTLTVDQTYLLVGVAIVLLVALGLNAREPRRLVWIVIIGIVTTGAIRSGDFILNDVLKPHQRKRIASLVNPNADPLGVGWNVTQSKIAIGSGGLSGKGFLEGTQTKFDFVPAQTTDFIFCTIGEEHGWVGSVLVLMIFGLLIYRILVLAEKQKSTFSRIYGYGVASIIFFHFAVNIAMTIGLFPVIGIPLPFFSYGGSSLWAFTLLLFIFLNLEANDAQVLHRW